MPTDMCGSFKRRSRARISIPPVVAPLENTIPSPAPHRTPPKMAATSFSSPLKSRSYFVPIYCVRSIRPDKRPVATIVRIMNVIPKTFQETTKSGMLIAKTNVPIGIAGIRWWTITAMPVTPPVTKCMGVVKMTTPMAYIRQPAHHIKNSKDTAPTDFKRIPRAASERSFPFFEESIILTYSRVVTVLKICVSLSKSFFSHR